MIEIKTENLTYNQRKRIEARKSKITGIIIIISLILVGAYTYHLIIRSEYVYDFRKHLSHTRINNPTYFSEFENTLRTRNSKCKMLLSFKPLKVDKWFTPEEIEKFNLKVE